MMICVVSGVSEVAVISGVVVESRRGSPESPRFTRRPYVDFGDTGVGKGTPGIGRQNAFSKNIWESSANG